MSNTNDPGTADQNQAIGDVSEDQLTAEADRAVEDELPVEDANDLTSQLQQANANYLRAKAEVENILKRTRREIADERRYATLPVMRDLLTVADNLQRAIDAAHQDESSSGLLEGVKMVGVQLDNTLDQHGCKRIKAVGEPFDPNLHEAAGQEPSDEVPQGHVSRELRVGYQLHDRVVRPSQVLISTGPAGHE